MTMSDYLSSDEVIGALMGDMSKIYKRIAQIVNRKVDEAVVAERERCIDWIEEFLRGMGLPPNNIEEIKVRIRRGEE